MLKINKEVSSKKIKGKKLNGFSLANIINDFLSFDIPNINQMLYIINIDGIILSKRISLIFIIKHY
jgi:hypothetical protein